MKKNAMICLMLSFVFLSCQKENEIIGPSTSINEENSNGLIELGDEIPNAFTVENMEMAYERLKSSGSNIPAFKAKTTHVYLRFLPNDFEELDILKKDSTLLLFEYPLHYKIKKAGRYYHDPLLPADAITWQYCIFSINNEIPKIKHEIICELCMPDIQDNENLKSELIHPDFYDRLEIEALRLVDTVNSLKSTNIDTWTPSGKITCDGFPIEGIEAIARNGLHIHKGLTDGEGNFTVDGTFTSDVQYSVNWERYQFSIREGELWQASYIANNESYGKWNATIGTKLNEEESVYHARIFRAAYHYYYKDIHGLKRPPLNSSFRPQMKIGAYYQSNEDENGLHAAWKRVLGILSRIVIYNPERGQDKIYGTVIHELAHASHWDIDASDFNSTEEIVIESWARGVQWSLTRMVYPSFSNYYEGVYTGIVEDMIDGIPSPNAYDQVSGYSILQLENALKNQKTWASWKNNIINNYYNGTENNLDALFNYWN
jgi:hypothetical protein